MKRSALIIVLGFFMTMGGLSAFASGQLFAALVVAAGVVLLYWQIVVIGRNQKAAAAEAEAARVEAVNRQKRAAEERISAAEAERAAAAAKQAAWEASHGRISFAIAGVTFNNEDGSSRQKILRDLKARGDEAEVELEEFEYKGKQGLSLRRRDGREAFLRDLEIGGVLC